MYARNKNNTVEPLSISDLILVQFLYTFLISFNVLYTQYSATITNYGTNYVISIQQDNI